MPLEALQLRPRGFSVRRVRWPYTITIATLVLRSALTIVFCDT